MTLPINVIKEIRANAKSLRSYDFSEADTISHLIDPVLGYFGYTPRHQRREGQIKQNRPDIAVWEEPAHMASGLAATAIIEAKPLGADLNGNGKAKQERPKEQIARYVTGYERSSPNTLGILTDGNIWHIVVPAANRRQSRYLKEILILDGPPEGAALALEELKGLLHQERRISLKPTVITKDARDLANAIAEGMSPSDILLLLTKTANYATDLTGQVDLQGKAEMAEANYWESYAYATIGRIKTEQADLSHESLCLAVLRMARANSLSDTTIYREDVATAAATFAKTVPVKMSILLVIQPDENGNPVNSRLAVHHQGHTGMTTQFDPYTPSPFILRSIQRIYDQLINGTAPVPAVDIAGVVAAKGVRKEFYDAVASGWTLRQYRKARGGVKARRKYRETVLRHLIRTLFAWILKEEGKLPQEAFDQVFAATHAPGDYHGQILTFLFHERLNKPHNMRNRHPEIAVGAALQDTRFLNGSLFTRHEHDDELHLEDEEYFGTDPERQGLFTILSEYEWTASEHTPTHSDQTIDPEVLGNLFENLIAVTEVNDTPDRMPEGTYYTPADVAKEMVKDALMMATKKCAPNSWSEADLLDLFGDSEMPDPVCTEQERERLRKRIEELTIFDPSVGSGVFPLSTVYAMRTALVKLGRDDGDGRITRQVIIGQIHAQDINPMAVQVTRLRLFIAIIAAETNESLQHLPLPNLEARVVCADTTCTIPNRSWSLTTTGGLQDADVNITSALSELASIRDRWQDAHEESQKSLLRLEDEEARARLKKAIRGGIAGAETKAFADHPLLEPDSPPAQTDSRLLFYRENWAGFDIVIGNPPYERIAAQRPADQRKLIRAQLTDRGYTTVSCNDLYALIAEAGLTLVRPDDGVLTLIVPLSICFGQNKGRLRTLIQRNCSEVRLRSHDNRPEPVFKESPVAHPENRQRTTILTAITSDPPSKVAIRVSGTNKWRRSERHTFLAYRAYNRQPDAIKSMDSRIELQWARIPTADVTSLITRMRNTSVKLSDLVLRSEGMAELGFPKTAYEFITAAPTGKLNRGESKIPVGSEDSLAIAMAVANNHVAYTWWKVYGDAFHVNQHEMATIAIPDEWVEVKETKRKIIALGMKLIGAINPSNIKVLTSGTKGAITENVNFHECAAETVAEIDRLYLRALGLTPEPLLTQLHTVRSNSTWKVGTE